MSETTSAAQSEATESDASLDDGKSAEWRVRERAHALWEHEGRPEGRHEQHWEQAQREIEDDKAELASEESFPASDAPANSGITGP